MGPGIVSFMFAAGATTWLYAKFLKYSGNNTKSAVWAAGISGVVIFFIFYIIFKMIVKS